jgi:hypothetical protein
MTFDLAAPRPRERFGPPDIDKLPHHRWMLDPRNPERVRESFPYPPWARVSCPTCGVQIGEPCEGSGSQTEHEPWASDRWATAHSERHSMLASIRTLEDVHDPGYLGWEPHPGHWAVAWLHGNDVPLATVRDSSRRKKR